MIVKIRKLVPYVRNFKVHHKWVKVSNITPNGMYQINDSIDDDIYILYNKKRIDNFGEICDLIYKIECDYHKAWLRNKNITDILLR